MVLPSDSDQKNIMDFIYNQVKSFSNMNTDRINSIVDKMLDEGVDSVILGCTELSVTLNKLRNKEILVDPLEILAYKTIVANGKEPKNFPTEYDKYIGIEIKNEKINKISY